MKKTKEILSALLGVSKAEFSGFRLLVFTGVICSLGLFAVNHVSFSPYTNYERDSGKLDSLLVIMDSIQAKSGAKKVAIVLEKFDPNVATEQQLISYGFPTWLASRLVKYRSTGARFKKPNDLLKLYGFPESLFMSIKDSVVIKQAVHKKVVPMVTEVPKIKKQYEEKLKVLPVFDLNLADTSVFKTVKGVGSKLSARIIKYRSSLGGFVSSDQLYQVFGLDSAVIHSIMSTSIITLDFIPSKINVNTASKEQLAAHPYISWTEAKLILAYRNQHGNFSEPNDLVKVYTIDDSWIKKNAPYLTF